METYEPETDFPSDEPTIIYETSWPKTIFLAFIIAFAAGTLAYSMVYLGFSSQFLTDQDCNALVNQSYFNGTQVGYQLGVMDTSNFVLRTEQLPVFVNNSGVIEIQYLNLTQEDKKNE